MWIRTASAVTFQVGGSNHRRRGRTSRDCNRNRWSRAAKAGRGSVGSRTYTVRAGEVPVLGAVFLGARKSGMWERRGSAGRPQRRSKGGRSHKDLCKCQCRCEWFRSAVRLGSRSPCTSEYFACAGFWRSLLVANVCGSGCTPVGVVRCTRCKHDLHVAAVCYCRLGVVSHLHIECIGD